MSRVIQEPQTFPDQWSWHMEGGEESTDMAKATSSFRSLLSSFGIRPGPVLDININEYGVYGEQLPSAGAWWIAGLERENAHGLRGNWAMSGALHDFLAGASLIQPWVMTSALTRRKAFLASQARGLGTTQPKEGNTGPQRSTKSTITTPP